MTRRLLTALSLTAIVSGGFVAVASSSSAYEDSPVCVGSESQRRPGQYTYVCVDPRTGGGTVTLP